MKKTLFVIVICLLMTGFAYAVEQGTAKEAQDLVGKAIAYYKTNGKDKAFEAISDRNGQFVKKDLYIFVYDMSGKCMAHGFNKMRVGKDLIAMKDQNGVFYVKERIELANAKGKGWQNYKETNPVTKKIEPKRAYIEKEDNYIFGSGFYRK